MGLIKITIKPLYKVFQDFFGSVLIVILLAVGILFLPSPYIRELVIFGIYVLAFNLLHGYLGLVSLGHPLYLGIGAYATALFLAYVNPNPFLAILAGLAAGALIGLALGPLLVRLHAAYFTLTNLAFCAAGYFLIYQPLKDITGGMDGIWYKGKIATTPLFNLNNHQDFFFFELLVALVVLIVYKRLVSSAFGVSLRGIKENEVKMRFLGYDTFKIKCLAFMFSTTLAALAGSLYAVYLGFLCPSVMEPIRASEVIFASLLGGPGTFYGPYVGAALYMGVKDLISKYVVRWEALVGLSIILVMFRFSRGVWGSIEPVLRKRLSKMEMVEPVSEGRK